MLIENSSLAQSFKPRFASFVIIITSILIILYAQKNPNIHCMKGLSVNINTSRLAALILYYAREAWISLW